MKCNFLYTEDEKNSAEAERMHRPENESSQGLLEPVRTLFLQFRMAVI